MDVDHVEPVVEVFAELALAHIRGEVAVRRGDEAEVDAYVFVAADALYGARLEGPEELYLRGEVDLRYLVEEERSAAGSLELSDLRAVCAGERAFLVAEELGLDERRRKRRALDGDERSGRSRRQVVERLCDELLSRSRRAFDKDVCVCLCRLPDEPVDFFHRGRLARESLDAALLVDLLLQLRYLARERVLLERLLYALLHLGEVGDRLCDEVVRAFLHRLDRELYFAERRDQDARERWVRGLCALYEGDSVLAWHLVVGE